MCVTHIYTDVYPKKRVEFHQTIVCADSKDGTSCPAHITNKHTPRTLKAHELPSKELIDQGLKVPSASKHTSPEKPATMTTYRYSPQVEKKAASPGRETRLRLVRKRSALMSALTPRRRNTKERIVIVDAPPSPKGSHAHGKYAPDSPATDEFHQSDTLLLTERSRRHESASPRRSPNRSPLPSRTVVVEHHDRRERSKEREHHSDHQAIVLAPEPPQWRDRDIIEQRTRREEDERRELERQLALKREHERKFELLHEARREEGREEERERERIRKVAEDLEKERILKEQADEERRKDAEFARTWRIEQEAVERERVERERMDREIERAREEDLSRERRRDREIESDRQRKRDEEIRRREHEELDRERRREQDEHLRREAARRDRIMEKERELAEKEKLDRMRKAEKSERKAADDARRLAEQVRRENEEIKKRPVVPIRERERDREIEEWKERDREMAERLRERQAAANDGERDLLDRLKDRQSMKGPEVGYMPKRRTTIGGGRRRADASERIVWGDGEGRSGRW
ncbi:hypothetical protein CJF31_00010460 [Rutstroemia sp. NJR-2017a BVV2]|nr:hypothetical protein CJF31_00010460 [Rutstroemia sp. NJR-2017a BVV2]